MVGVNRYIDDSPPLSIQAPDFSALEGEQRARLAEIKRSGVMAVQSRLALEEGARCGGGL